MGEEESVHILWPLRGLPLEDTSGSIRLKALEAFPWTEAGGKAVCEGTRTQAWSSVFHQDSRTEGGLLLFLPQLLCTEYHIGFLTTFSASMLLGI